MNLQVDESANPGINNIVDDVLNESLSGILDDNQLVDQIYEQFMGGLSAYRNAIVTSFNNAIRNEMYGRILEDEYAQLREKAIEHAMSQIRSEGEIIKIREAVQTRLVEDLRPTVISELRAELKSNPEFVAGVKAELKREILGL